MAGVYTTQLQAGLGMIPETRALLSLWEPGMTVSVLSQTALQSGHFPSVSARRLRNVVAECFAPRLMQDCGGAAHLLKGLDDSVTTREFEQLLFIFTCRANAILADFVREVFWSAYRSGRVEISNDDAKDFVVRANQDGKTSKYWSESTIRRVAAYLTGACADFGLLEQGRRGVRRILSYRVEPRVAGILAYDLHFSGLGDNGLISHPDWQLFGLEPADVLDELKRLSRKGLFIIQHAGAVTRISWAHSTMEEVADAVVAI
jgi:hypothetical protein